LGGSTEARGGAGRWRRRAGAALLAAGLALLLGEILLRFALSDRRVSEGEGAAAYFRALGTHDSDGPRAVAAAPKTKFRIVVMGDSTAVGFPYAEGLSFGAFLAIGLSASSGTACDFEIVGYQGRSSAGVVANLEQAFALAPDLLLLYAGHNEFALRISVVSPFGRPRTGLLDTLLHGYATLFRRLRESAEFRRAGDTAGMPTMFPAELGTGLRLLVFGDPETEPPVRLPLMEIERTYHLERYAANVRAIVEAAGKRKIPLFVVEPTSSLLAPPLSSGAMFDRRAVEAWNVGIAARGGAPEDAKKRLLEARDLDPAPIRLTTPFLAKLREAAGPNPTIAVEGDPLEERFVDLVHPKPELAAEFAERIATRLPPYLPRLDPNDPDAVTKFRAACAAHLAMPEVQPLRERGDELGRLLAAHMHLEYGNRAAAEREVLAVPAEKRNFGMTIVLDLALRFAGKAADADAILGDMARLHPDWEPSIAWWRARVGRL
jgi:hypothetical protein